jgi:hypothetical protein
MPAVPPLPDADFALRGWGSLSPPSNFQFPDGFDPAPLPAPKSKDGAGRLGGCGASDAGAQGLRLGPTDFSQLFATMEGASAGPCGHGQPCQRRSGSACSCRQAGRVGSHGCSTVRGGCPVWPSGVRRRCGCADQGAARTLMVLCAQLSLDPWRARDRTRTRVDG